MDELFKDYEHYIYELSFYLQKIDSKIGKDYDIVHQIAAACGDYPALKWISNFVEAYNLVMEISIMSSQEMLECQATLEHFKNGLVATYAKTLDHKLISELLDGYDLKDKLHDLPSEYIQKMLMILEISMSFSA